MPTEIDRKGRMNEVDLTFHVSREEAIKLLELTRKPPVIGVVFFKGKGAVVSDTITVVDNAPPFTATVSWADAEGVPTTPAGGTNVVVDDGNVCNVISDDGTTFTFNPGSPGASVVHFHPLDENGQILENNGVPVDVVGTVTVVAGTAVTGVVDFEPGAPTGS